MVWLTQQERLTLTVLGGLALTALGILLWQQRRPPLTVELGPSPSYAQWDAQLRDSKLVDLNQATAEELERLPEIGPTLAVRIVAYRDAHGPFRRSEDLQKVPGIGPKTFEIMRDYVKVN